jgi:DNA mismatch repair protein MutL
MSQVIKLLPDSVANQIAAGEVIQRPASVIKELMENSVDAGAENIRVIVKDSGKTLIQVIDDGCGMSETDARLSFERHATSKISTANDLFAITTKGFRGEALASIAAVSMVELRTRTEENETGILIRINGSRVELQEPCSCPKGSGFSVKNLFYNIPARRKFLKTDATEMRHITGEFQKIAIAHPEIRFSLYHNDTEIYNLPESNIRQRIIGLFGRQINQDLVTIDTTTSLIDVSGFIGKPENARRTYGEQFFFVNNRFMKHPYFHKAVMEAYNNILPSDVIPSYFIFLTADPASIDINIHPTKTEIKFEDERDIWQIIMASVREAIGRFNISPSLDFENEALIEIPVKTEYGAIPETPSIDVNTQYNPFDSDANHSNRRTFIERFERESHPDWGKLYDGLKKEDKSSENVAGDTSRKLFQVKNKYIICPVKSGLMIIDQKRAHERILYERYLNNLNNHIPVTQSEMFPVKIELNPGDYQILTEIEEDIVLLGFNIRHTGNNVISLDGIPADNSIMNAEEIFRLIMEDYKSTRNDPGKSLKEKVACALARTAAIPYGRAMGRNELERFFDMLFSCPAPNYSPSGKPVIHIIDMEDIEKKFK